MNSKFLRRFDLPGGPGSPRSPGGPAKPGTKRNK